MDVLSVIKGEHRSVAALIDEANECEPGDERLRELALEIRRALELHVAVEEKLFYAPLRKLAPDDEGRVEMFEAYTEHDVARHLIELLKSKRTPPERFKAELQVLGESVKHHVQEEESKVFAIAREVLDQDELEEIGASWERTKERLQKASHRGARR
jgi:hemerythrin-like domain-containing protein